MFDFSCMNRPAAPPELLLLSQGWYSALMAFLLIGLFAAALVAPFVQSAYRRRIVRLMRFNQVTPRPTGWWTAHGLTGRDQRIATHAPTVHTEDIDLRAFVWQRERRAALSTLLAWVIFVFTALPVAYLLMAADSGFSDRIAFVAGAAVLSLGPAVINLPPRHAQWSWLVALAVCALAAIIQATLVPPEPATAVAHDKDEEFGVVGYALLAAVGCLVLRFVSSHTYFQAANLRHWLCAQRLRIRAIRALRSERVNFHSKG